MAFSSCLLCPQIRVPLRMDGLRLACCKSRKLIGYPLVEREVKQQFLSRTSFTGHRRMMDLGGKSVSRSKSSAIHASWVGSSQIASSAFTWGTVAVLPFYTLMVLAPKAELTKKMAASSIPYVFLGTLYAYLLYLSWTPDTIHLMFASKYWLPELSGIAKMFSGEMTLASAWIHLLAVDLFAARQVYFDGVQGSTETRHSISLCLLFCPIGILSHIVTKALTAPQQKPGHEMD